MQRKRRRSRGAGTDPLSACVGSRRPVPTFSVCRSQQLSLTSPRRCSRTIARTPLEHRRAPTAFHADPEAPKAAKLNCFWVRHSSPINNFGIFGLSGPAGASRRPVPTFSGCRSQQLSLTCHRRCSRTIARTPLEHRRAPTAVHADPEAPKAPKLNCFWVRKSPGQDASFH